MRPDEMPRSASSRRKEGLTSGHRSDRLLRMEIPECILDVIRNQVRGGYDDREAILLTIAEWYGAELGIDESVTRVDDIAPETLAAVRAAIDAAFAKHAEDMRSWPAVTDCDRLAKAFLALDQIGILALENCGADLDDGILRACHVDLDREEAGAPKSRGYCFFHQQDVMRAVAGTGLMLAYGTFEEADPQKPAAQKTQEIGQVVVATLRAHGFEVTWNGSPGSRIALPGFRWQRRGSAAGA